MPISFFAKRSGREKRQKEKKKVQAQILSDSWLETAIRLTCDVEEAVAAAAAVVVVVEVTITTAAYIMAILVFSSQITINFRMSSLSTTLNDLDFKIGRKSPKSTKTITATTTLPRLPKQSERGLSDGKVSCG